MIPYAPTMISVYGRAPNTEHDNDAEGYDGPEDPPVLSLMATGVRASISQKSDWRRGNEQSNLYVLRCDKIDSAGNEFSFDRFMEVVDITTHQRYEVVSVMPSIIEALGLDHYRAEIKHVVGLPDKAAE